MGNQSSNGSENQSNSVYLNIFNENKQKQETIEGNEYENSDRNYPYLISQSESDSHQNEGKGNFVMQPTEITAKQQFVCNNMDQNFLKQEQKINKRQLSPIHVESSSSQQNENSSIENSTDHKIYLQFMENRLSQQNNGQLKQQAFIYQPEQQKQVFESLQDGQTFQISQNLISKNYPKIQYQPAIYTTQQQSKESLFLLSASTPSHNAIRSGAGSHINSHDGNQRKSQIQKQYQHLSPKDDRLSTIVSGADIDQNSSQNSLSLKNQQNGFQEKYCDYQQNNLKKEYQLDSSLKQEMQFDNQLSQNRVKQQQIQQQVYEETKFSNGGLGSFGSDGMNKHHILKSNKYSSSSFYNSSLQYTQSNPEFDKKNYNFLALKGDSISSMESNNQMAEGQNYFHQQNNFLNKKPSYINSVESIENQFKMVSEQEQLKASLPSLSGQYNVISKFSNSGPYDLSDEYVDSHRQFQIIQDSENYESLQVQQNNQMIVNNDQIKKEQNNTERTQEYSYNQQYQQNNLFFLNKNMYEQTQLIDEEYKKLVQNQMLIQNQQNSEKNQNSAKENNYENNVLSINRNFNSEQVKGKQITNSSEPVAAKKYEIYSFQNPFSSKLSIQSFKNGCQGQSSGHQHTSIQEKEKNVFSNKKNDDIIIGEQTLNTNSQICQNLQNQYCMSTINHKTIESGSYVNSIEVSSCSKIYQDGKDPEQLANLQSQTIGHDIQKQIHITSKTQSKFRNIGDLVSEQNVTSLVKSTDEEQKGQSNAVSRLNTEGNSNNQRSSKFSSIGTRSSITLQQNSPKSKLQNKYKVVPVVDGFKLDGINSIKYNAQSNNLKQINDLAQNKYSENNAEMQKMKRVNQNIQNDLQNQQYNEAIRSNSSELKHNDKSQSRSKSRDKSRDQSQSGKGSMRRNQQTNEQPQLMNVKLMQQQNINFLNIINDSAIQKKENEFNRIHVISTQRSSSQNQRQFQDSYEDNYNPKTQQSHSNIQHDQKEGNFERQINQQPLFNYQYENQENRNQMYEYNEQLDQQSDLNGNIVIRIHQQDAKIKQDQENSEQILEKQNIESMKESLDINNYNQSNSIVHQDQNLNAQSHLKQEMSSVSCPQLLQQSQVSSPQMCHQNNDYWLNTNSQNTQNNKKADQFKLEEQTTTLQSSAAMPPHLLNSIIPADSQQSQVDSNQLQNAHHFKQMNFYEQNNAQKNDNYYQQDQHYQNNFQMNIQDQSMINQMQIHKQNELLGNTNQNSIMADVIGKCEMKYNNHNEAQKYENQHQKQINKKHLVYTNYYPIGNPDQDNLKIGKYQAQNQFYVQNEEQKHQLQQASESDTQNTYGNSSLKDNIYQQKSDDDILMYSQENYTDQNYEGNHKNEQLDSQFQNSNFQYANNYNGEQFYPTLQNEQDIHCGALGNQQIFYQNHNENSNSNCFEKQIPISSQESENNYAGSVRIDNMNQSNPYKNILQNTLGVSDATQFLMLGTLPNGPVIGQSLNGTQNEQKGFLQIADSTGIGSYQVIKNDEKEDSGQFYESPTLGSQQESFLMNGNRQIEKQTLDNRNQFSPQVNQQNSYDNQSRVQSLQKVQKIQSTQQMHKQPKHLVNRTYSFANQQNTINYPQNMSTINHESFINQNVAANYSNQDITLQNQYQDQDISNNYMNQQQQSPLSRNNNDDFQNNIKNINDKTKSTLGFQENQENWNMNSQQKINQSKGLIHAESTSIQHNYVYPTNSSNNLLNVESDKIIDGLKINADRLIYQKKVSQFAKNYNEINQRGRIPFQSNYGKQVEQKQNRSSSLHLKHNKDLNDRVNQNFDLINQFGLRSQSLNNNNKQDMQLNEQAAINQNNKSLLKTQNPISNSQLQDLPQLNYFGDTSSLAPGKQIIDVTSNSFSLPQNPLQVNNQSSKNSQLNQQTMIFKDFLKQDLLSAKKLINDAQDQNYKGENSRILSYSPKDFGYGSQNQMNTSQNKIDNGIHQYVQESLNNLKSCYPPDIIEGKFKQIHNTYGSVPHQPLKLQYQNTENLRLDHENNLQNLRLIGDIEEIIQQKNEKDQQILDLKSQNMKMLRDLEKQTNYIEDLQKLNDLQKEESICLNKKNSEMKNKFASQFHQMNVELGSLQKKKMRGVEKVYTQVLQLHSSSQHLKELINLAKLDEYKCNIQMIIQYVENNFESSVLKLLQILNQNNQNSFETKDQQDSESSQQYDKLAYQLKNLQFDTTKLQTRAQNFKKFRQSTQEIIDSLFNQQMKQKCDIINDFQKQISQISNEKEQLNKMQQGQINELKEQLQKLRNDKIAITDEINNLKNRELPMLNSLLLEKELSLKKEFNEKENQMNSKIVKQKYQIKEFEEKEKNLRSENTELRIKLEGIKVRLQDQKEHNVSREYINYQAPMPQNEQAQSHEKPYEALLAALNKDSFESYQLIQKQKEKSHIMKKKYKEVQLTTQQEKRDLNEKIEFYKETVKNQAEVIEQLQKLSHMQKQIILQSSQSAHTMMLGASQSQKLLGEHTQTQDSMKDIGSISDKNTSNSQRYKRVQSMQIQKDYFKQVPSNQAVLSGKAKQINVISDYAPTARHEDTGDKQKDYMVPQKIFMNYIDKSSSSMFQQPFENIQKPPVFYNNYQRKEDFTYENKYNERNSFVLKPLTITSNSDSTDNKQTQQENQKSFENIDENQNQNNKINSQNQSSIFERQNMKSLQNYYNTQNLDDSFINQQNTIYIQHNLSHQQNQYYQSQQYKYQNTLQNQPKQNQFEKPLQQFQKPNEQNSEIVFNKYKNNVQRNDRIRSKANSKSPQKSNLPSFKIDQQVIQTLSLEETQQEQNESQNQYSQIQKEDSNLQINNEILIEKNEYKGISMINSQNQLYINSEIQEQQDRKQIHLSQIIYDQNNETNQFNENSSENQQTVINNQSVISEKEIISQTQSEVQNSMTLLQRKIHLLEKKLNSKKIGTKYSPILERQQTDTNEILLCDTSKTVRIKDELQLYQDHLDSDEYRSRQIINNDFQNSNKTLQNIKFEQVHKSGNNYNGLNLQNEISQKESTLYDGVELDKVIVVNINSDRRRVSKERNHHFISNSQESNNENPLPLQKFIHLQNDENSASLRTSQLTSQDSQ